MSIAEQTQPADEHCHPELIDTPVNYLPAAHPYRHEYSKETLLETVRVDATSTTVRSFRRTSMISGWSVRRPPERARPRSGRVPTG
jgi:hypothetical protein